ncbi:hypothetical protein ACHAXR_000596, partial [Thalassiosira sp. AJA248-18]
MIAKLLLLYCLVAAVLTSSVTATTGEATIDEFGNVVTSDDADGTGVDPSIPLDEELTITVTNYSPYRIDVYYDDGEYGSLISTLEKEESTGINSFIGHSFFVTRHGVKEGLFADEKRLVFDVGQRNQEFIVPRSAAPSTNPCQDRFSICKSQAKTGGCERSPGWMIVHCCESCDPYLNASELIDPKKRCSKEHLKTPEPAWKAGDLNKLFASWATNEELKQKFGLEVISSPEPEKYGATWEKASDGAPWVVVFDNFLNDQEIADLIRGGELEGYERSTDQGASNEIGEMEKVVSKTRTSANAWCMHKCGRLPGVKSATKK